MSRLAGSKLTYFKLPGRAESIRLALLHGGVEFTDHRIEFPQWPELKPTTPFGSLPNLELSDGTVLAQAKAIMRLVAKDTGLYPSDTMQAFRAEELLDFLDDVQTSLNNVGRGMEKEQKDAARKEASLTGSFHGHLKTIEAFIDKHGSDGHVVGSQLTFVDFAVFAAISSFVCGFFDGVPLEALDPFPKIQAVRKTVASLPAAVKFYEAEENNQPLRHAFKTAKDL